MNINLTLFGQMVTFAFFVWFCMKFVWPVILQAMEERQQKIAEGLDAADRALRDLDDAQSRVADQLSEAKQSAADIPIHREQFRKVSEEKWKMKNQADKALGDVEHLKKQLEKRDKLIGELKSELRTERAAVEDAKKELSLAKGEITKSQANIDKLQLDLNRLRTSSERVRNIIKKEEARGSLAKSSSSAGVDTITILPTPPPVAAVPPMRAEKPSSQAPTSSRSRVTNIPNVDDDILTLTASAYDILFD